MAGRGRLGAGPARVHGGHRDPDRVGVHLRRRPHQRSRVGEGRAGLAENFSQGDRIDDAVIIYSADLTSDDPEFKAFVADVRSSIKATGAAETVRDPYAADESGISEDGHAAVVTLVLGHDAETGIVEVMDEVAAADADTELRGRHHRRQHPRPRLHRALGVRPHQRRAEVRPTGRA